MAWRPARFLIKGKLNNTRPGKITGWMRFVGKKEKVIFDLEGDFQKDIRGAKIRFRGYAEGDVKRAREYMKGFGRYQIGKAGDMTAGFVPPDRGLGYCYLEWFSKKNGRVVIELEQNRVELLSKPLPACEIEPVSKDEPAQTVNEFLAGLAKAVNIPAKDAVCKSDDTVTGNSRKEVRV